MPSGMTGKKMTGRRKIGWKLSEETKRRISEGAKRNGVGKWFIGRKFSEHHRKNI